MNRKWIRLLFLMIAPVTVGLTLWYLFTAAPVLAATVDVCDSGCTYSSIQGALNGVNSGDVINIFAGTYTESLNVNVNVTLQANTGATVIVDGSGTSRVVGVTSGTTLTITGLTIRNGGGITQGGGLFNEEGVVIINNSTFTSNSADTRGGAIANLGELTLNNVIIEDNQAGLGAGLYNGENNSTTLTNVTFTGNDTGSNIAEELGGGGVFNDLNGQITMSRANFNANSAEDNGGGIWNIGEMNIEGATFTANESEIGAGILNEGQMTLIAASIEQNQAGTNGGGIRNSFEMTLTGSIVDANTAPLGAGIYHEGQSLRVVQSVIKENVATGSGGAIYFGDPFATGEQLFMENSTISGNSASGNGGGLFLTEGGTAVLHNVTLAVNSGINGAGGIHVANGQITLMNSIVSGNLNGDCAGSISSAGYNIASDGTCALSGSGDINNVDPLLGDLADNGGNTETHALLEGSVAIDTGFNCPAVDQRDVARPIGPACDRGAFEAESTTQRTYLPFIVK